MDNNSLFNLKMNEWNRNKINAYWYIIIILFLATLTGFVVIWFRTPEIVYYYIVNYIFIPVSFLVIIIALLENVNKHNSSISDYIFIITDSLITITLIIIFSGHAGLYLILVAPIIISAFYFNKMKIIFSTAINIIAFFLLYSFHKDLQREISILEVISTVAIYLGGLAIALGIVNRANFLMKSLQKTMKSEQDLVIRNALMDKSTKMDALTELYNHKTFHDYLGKLIEQSETYQMPLQLIIIDIDNFKFVNDAYGHWVGDLILKRVAACIRTSITSSDISARYGGEEFTVIFTEKTDEEARQLAENIRHNISNLMHSELKEEHITVSIGLQSYKSGSGKERFFKETDACLYEAKHTGKNKVVTQMSRELRNCSNGTD